MDDAEGLRIVGARPMDLGTRLAGAFEKGAVSGPLFRGDVIAGPATIRVWSDASYGGTNSAFVTLERWRVLKSK